MRILLVATADAEPLGTGWNRRVYQIQCDLIESCDAEVVLFNAGRAVESYLPAAPPNLRSLPERQTLRWFGDRLAHKARKTISNPLRLLWRRAPYSTDILRGEALSYFRRFVDQNGPFDALVCDNSRFSASARHMMGSEVPCFYVLMHLESLVYGQNALLRTTRKKSGARNRPALDLLITGADLAEELAVLAQADGVFAISSMECEFLAATGIESDYYPYEPKGKTLAWCNRICSARARNSATHQATFLSTGSLNPHNLESLAIMLGELLSTGLPSNCELLVTGMDPPELFDRVPELHARGESLGIRVLGNVDQSEFRQLLTSAAALTVPGYVGFGALTRFADAAACGIPVLTNVPSRVSGLGADQALVVERPGSWRGAMEHFIRAGGDLTKIPSSVMTERSRNPLRKIRSKSSTPRTRFDPEAHPEHVFSSPSR
jgi:hypothetical protein